MLIFCLLLRYQAGGGVGATDTLEFFQDVIIEAKKKETLIIAIKQDKNAVYKVIAAKDS